MVGSYIFLILFGYTHQYLRQFAGCFGNVAKRISRNLK